VKAAERRLHQNEGDIMTTKQTRRRIGAATLAIAAGALIVGTLDAAAPAQASDFSYVAIAYSPSGHIAKSVFGPDAHLASLWASQECYWAGHTIGGESDDCQIVAQANSGNCAAIAIRDDHFAGADGDSRAIAESRALIRNFGGHIVDVQCTATA
jgi:hypothetical protein